MSEQDMGQEARSSLTMIRRALPLVVLCAVVACGDAPLQSIGLRSSDWINEPSVPTTVAVVTTIPTNVTVDRLLWANDEIEAANHEDRDALLATVFARREGDRFIQASRSEIAGALPEIAFPARAPSGAEWVSSQLVFNNDGSVADDPSAAFGIWSAEPYTRSRSVAQMAVLRVATDPEGAEEILGGQAEASCARFSDRSTDQCEIVTIGDRPTWVLMTSGNPTLVWFQNQYRYELFGRSFVPLGVLQDMSAEMVPLGAIGATS